MVEVSAHSPPKRWSSVLLQERTQSQKYFFNVMLNRMLLEHYSVILWAPDFEEFWGNISGTSSYNDCGTSEQLVCKLRSALYKTKLLKSCCLFVPRSVKTFVN